MWTGRYSRSHGLRRNGKREPLEEVTFAEILQKAGYVTGGWQMARAAAAAARRIAAGDADKSFYKAKIVTARFYAEQIMPVACSYRKAIESGSETIMALSEEQF